MVDGADLASWLCRQYRVDALLRTTLASEEAVRSGEDESDDGLARVDA